MEHPSPSLDVSCYRFAGFKALLKQDAPIPATWRAVWSHMSTIPALSEVQHRHYHEITVLAAAHPNTHCTVSGLGAWATMAS